MAKKKQRAYTTLRYTYFGHPADICRDSGQLVLVEIPDKDVPETWLTTIIESEKSAMLIQPNYVNASTYARTIRPLGEQRALRLLYRIIENTLADPACKSYDRIMLEQDKDKVARQYFALDLVPRR